MNCCRNSVGKGKGKSETVRKGEKGKNKRHCSMNSPTVTWHWKTTDVI